MESPLVTPSSEYWAFVLNQIVIEGDLPFEFHGGVPDFQGDLQILRDANNAKSSLKEVVKALLRHSLQEPQLYKDLRAC